MSPLSACRMHSPPIPHPRRQVTFIDDALGRNYARRMEETVRRMLHGPDDVLAVVVKSAEVWAPPNEAGAPSFFTRWQRTVHLPQTGVPDDPFMVSVKAACASRHY